MAIATALVVGLTAIAPVLGPHTSGLVATFPVYVAVMAVFSQRHQGLAAIDLLRGLLAACPGTATFYAVIHVTIVPVGIAPGFLLRDRDHFRDPGTRASLGPRHVAGPDRARARLTSHVGGERCPDDAARCCSAAVLRRGISLGQFRIRQGTQRCAPGRSALLHGATGGEAFIRAGPAGVEWLPGSSRSRTSGAWSDGVGVPLRASRSTSTATTRAAVGALARRWSIRIPSLRWKLPAR